MKLNGFMCSYEAKTAQNANNSSKQQILIHLDGDLGEINAAEY